jgi:hypothetical protein
VRHGRLRRVHLVVVAGQVDVLRTELGRSRWIRQQRTRARGAHPAHRRRWRGDRHAAAPDPAVHGNVVTITTHNGVGDNSSPDLPGNAYVLDESYLTASGDLIGWGSCAEATEKAREACLDTQMSSMQWLGASILLALTAGIAAFVILWGRKRLV